MPGTTQTDRCKVIVIPRPLEDYFYGRLSERYAGRSDVKVVVDRRLGERRRRRWAAGPGPLTERRGGDRRTAAASWSLPEMPFAAS